MDSRGAGRPRGRRTFVAPLQRDSGPVRCLPARSGTARERQVSGDEVWTHGTQD